MRRDLPELVEVPQLRPLPAPASAVMAALRPFLSPERIARIETVVNGRTRRLVVVLDQTTDPHNAAAVLRSADAFGIQEVHVVAGEQPFTAPARVARGTAHWLDVLPHATPMACAEVLRGRGYRILVASMEGTISPAKLRELDRVAVVFGNEHLGVSPALRALADGTYAIPMHGFVESLNVSVAAAITMHAATHDRAGDLPEDERNELRARFMLASVRFGEDVVHEMLARAPSRLE
jgi:tRNA (guanosine-2'-O-)-methyltransferase